MHVFLYKNQQMFGSKQLKSKKFRGNVDNTLQISAIETNRIFIGVK